MLNLNERYLGVYNINWNEDYYHDWLVFGYNDIEKVIYCCGYIEQNENGTYYGVIKVNYENIIKAIKSVPNAYTRFKSRKLHNHSLIINKKYIEKVLPPYDLKKRLERFYSPLF